MAQNPDGLAEWALSVHQKMFESGWIRIVTGAKSSGDVRWHGTTALISTMLRTSC